MVSRFQLEAKKLLQPKEYDTAIMAKSLDHFIPTFLKAVQKVRHTGTNARLKNFKSSK